MKEEEQMVRRLEGEGRKSTEVGDSVLTRKAAIEYGGTRTGNRHR